MSRFAPDAPLPPQACARYADTIAMLDEPAPETPERAAARAHLAECQRCQRERQTLSEASAALRAQVEMLMAQAPTFTEEQIATRADDATSAAGRRKPLAGIHTRHAPPTTSRHVAPSHGAPRTWRRALSAIGGAAAMVAITALLVTTLTGHLLGRASTRQGTTPRATAIPLSALTLYTPGAPAPDQPSDLEAFRASDGARVHVTPMTPVQGWGLVYAQGVRYQITVPNANISDPLATVPAILSATRVSDGQTVWSERIDSIFASSLILVDGALYLDTQFGEANISNIHAVYAFRASDGTRLWRHDLADAPDGPPVVSDGAVYVAAGQSVIALRASDGALLWQMTLQTGGRQVIAAWASVANGALYLYVTLDTVNGQKDGYEADAYAMRLSDGAMLWRDVLATRQLNPADGPFPPVVADGVVYVRVAPITLTSQKDPLWLFALRASDGATLWRYTSTREETGNSGVPTIYPPAVANGVVYVTEDGGALTALSARDGHIIWQVNVDQTPSMDTYPFSISSPVVVDGVVFVITGNGFGSLVAVNASNGATLWRVPCGGLSAPGNYMAYQLVVGP